MKKVAIIFPKLEPKDSSHYPYWYKIFEKAGKKLDISILFESGKKGKLKNCETYTQKIQSKPFNLIERFILLLKLRLKGYKDFYIHYSSYSLFLVKLLGGKTYFWDCEFYTKKPSNKVQILAIKLTDYLVTGHEVIANQYKKILNLPNLTTKIIPNWVIENTASTQKPKLKAQKNVLFLHHLSERKGTKLLPEIITKTLSKIKNTKFTIIGDGPDFNYLNNWIVKNKLQKKVNLRKSIPQNKISNEFAKDDIFILPSLSEGFPRVILEAQKFGTPYISFNVGCIEQISPKKYPYIIKNYDVDLFSDSIIYLSKLTKSEKLSIKKSLQRNVLKYKLEDSVSKFISIFN